MRHLKTQTHFSFFFLNLTSSQCASAAHHPAASSAPPSAFASSACSPAASWLGCWALSPQEAQGLLSSTEGDEKMKWQM